MLFKLSNLNSNLALTLGYLNPASKNLALKICSHVSPVCSPMHIFLWLGNSAWDILG